MRISRTEWERIEPRLGEGFERALEDERVCALLDRATGACTVYDARPIACRAYGFYVGRDGGRWCATIEDAGDLTSGVVLGNHDVLERSLTQLGDTRTLAEWWRGGLPLSE
jgi:Fe-S-cluster containining protein